MDEKQYIDDLIAKGRKAQQEFATYSQEKVDEAVRAMGKKIYDNAEELAIMAVEETGMGNVEAKIAKNMGKPKVTWQKLKGVKSRGIINYIEDQGLVEVSKPIGVIGCITPSTNPTMTPIHNGMIALKGGNAILVGPHPSAKKVSIKTVEYMREALKEVGAPEDLIQIVPEPSIELSGLIMSECDATISTGGPGMVKAAYSSGKPAFGVGAGNMQVLVDRDVDIKEVIPKIVTGRTYDNGVLCTCEQNAIVPEEKYDEAIAELKKAGGFFVKEPKDIEGLRNALFVNGIINRPAVGASASKLAKLSGFEVPEDTKFLFAPAEKTASEGEALGREKLCVVLTLYKYKDFKDGANIAYGNVIHEGTGHSVVIHSNTKEHIEYFGELMPVSRVGVNMIGSSGVGGTLDNGLAPTATLGCGTWGNNSLSENLWWNHLVNISRIAYIIPGTKIPTDEEIWG